MPFIPHTEADIREMLATIGIDSIDDLFSEIPSALKINGLEKIPAGMSEMEVSRLMQRYADKDAAGLCFIGAGAYEHHIPAAIWDIVSRGEYLTAYTPYQAEASQGTLQLLYEFQTMMVNLTGMDVSNASLYDGASAVAEAVLMAARVQKKLKKQRILMPKTINPIYRQVVDTIVKNQDIEMVEIPLNEKTGTIDFAALQKFDKQEITALVIPMPNFFGIIEDVDALTTWVHAQKALVIAQVNPLALGLLKQPSRWGDVGADIVCGEAQPFGIPLSSGGPYLGFMTCKKELVRQLPGRIVGRTVDIEGKTAFTLTLQAREQHIRRAKATSNICTNQSLLVTAATIYLSLVGATGLQRTAAASHQNTIQLRDRLTQIAGVEVIFNSSIIFHEFVIRLPQPVNQVLEKLANLGIQGGYSLVESYPELGEALLVCVTETKSSEDIAAYADALEQVLSGKKINANDSCAIATHI